MAQCIFSEDPDDDDDEFERGGGGHSVFSRFGLEQDGAWMGPLVDS